MAIKMKIKNIKSIQNFEFDLPTERGLYAITGENGSGKSTILSCAATSFYNPLMYSYFGAPQEGAKIEFEYEGGIISLCERYMNISCHIVHLILPWLPSIGYPYQGQGSPQSGAVLPCG